MQNSSGVVLGPAEGDDPFIFVSLRISNAGGESKTLGPLVLQSGSRGRDGEIEVSLNVPVYVVELVTESGEHAPGLLGYTQLVPKDLRSRLAGESAVVELQFMRSEHEKAPFKISFTCVRFPCVSFTVSNGTAIQLDSSDGANTSFFELAVRSALRLTIIQEAGNWRYLSSLGTTVVKRIENLNKAIAIFSDALEAMAGDNHDRPSILSSLGAVYLHRFRTFGDIADLDECVRILLNVVLLLPEGHPSKPRHLWRLSEPLIIRSQSSDADSSSDADMAILCLELALELTPIDDQDKLDSLSVLGPLLHSRFQRLKNVNDVDRAIVILEDAIRLGDGAESHYEVVLLPVLAKCYHERYQSFGNEVDFHVALKFYQDHADCLPDSDAGKPDALADLGSLFVTRFHRSGDLVDLEQAVGFLEHGIEIMVIDNGPTMLRLLRYLAPLYQVRMHRFWDMRDVDKQIPLLRRSAALSADPTEKAEILMITAIVLRTRFMCLFQESDINSSVAIAEKALALVPKGHISRVKGLLVLGCVLNFRYKSYRASDDIHRACQILEEALALTPHTHGLRFQALAELGNTYHYRWQGLKDPKDLEKAIVLLKEAVQSEVLPGFVDVHLLSLSRRKLDLGHCLLNRYDLSDDLNDLNEGIRFCEEAHECEPARVENEGSMDLLYFLGHAYILRFMKTQDPLALERGITMLSSAARSSSGAALFRCQSASNWMKAARLCRHSSLLEASGLVIELLTQSAWLGIPMEDRYRRFTEWGVRDVARDAAAAAIDSGDPVKAVEWLEQGRSIIWGQLLQLRTPVNNLENTNPQLACDLRRVSRALEQAGRRHTNPVTFSGANSHPAMNFELTSEEEAKQHRSLLLEWEELITAAHILDSEFLQPKKLTELIPAAASGPIVILNASEVRCDALVLQPGRTDVVHVPLPEMNYAIATILQQLTGTLTSSGHRNIDELFAELRTEDPRASQFVHSLRLKYQGLGKVDFQDLLSAIWLYIVKPVLDSLSIQPESGVQREVKHITWCPTGPFAFLPIHAARFENTETGSIIWLDDLVASSYTPTITALLHPSKQDVQKFSLLAVAQSGEGRAYLPGAEEELGLICSHLGSLPSTCLTESEATVGTVLHAMRDSSWIHFACHGVQDRLQPSNSGLLLAGGERLTLSEIIELDRPKGGLAFLSACQTATGDEKLSEEAVHLAAGMLLAGYDGVIATMWSIGDREAPQVASDVYAHLFRTSPPDAGQAAYALRDAVRKLRQSRPASDFSWVPYIHTGK